MSTIAAISTPLSASGLGVIRISGEEAVSVGEKMFRPFKGGKELSKLGGYSCAYGRVFDSEGDIDEAVALLVKAQSALTTGEDGGCGSVIATAPFALLAMLGAGILLKKKED
jgi:tRNA modification GTPase